MVLRDKPEKVEERERTRFSLLRATLELAARHGYAGLGLREVARGAGIAPTSFYRHFADMEELGLALIRELVAPLLRDWLTRSKAQLVSALHPARALLDEARATLHREPEVMRFVLAERAGANVSCRRALRAELEQWAAGLAEVQLPYYASDALLTLLLEALARALDGEDAKNEQQIEQQLSLLLSTRSP